ncbi:MAG: hypothetical protein N2C12_13615 [Planctomycetales bacterium]
MMKETTAADVMEAQAATTPQAVQPIAGAEQLAKRIKQAVRRETGGRIHNLTVLVTGTDVVIEGFCSTFHCYQLAQHAAMRLAEDLAIDNQIDVL